MKKIIILWSIVMLSASNVMATELHLSINDIDIKKGGNIAVYIFVGEKGYPKIHKEARFKKVRGASNNKLEFRFKIPNYIDNLAIKVHHDINADGKVTKNWTGIIPKDGLGFSNKQKLSFSGVPKYKNSKLTKEQLSKKQAISLVYYSNR